MSASAIILAAGKSTRMNSARPKVLHEICGKPMLWYVLQACYQAGCARTIVIVGHGKEQVIAAFADDQRITWVEQTEQLGTGHAARMAETELRKHPHGDVFILAGDGPLIRSEVLRNLLDAHRQERAAASLATAELESPTGYGRIVRDGEGNFQRIVEELDCTPAQRQIREIFPSYYCVRSDELLHALGRLTNSNSKREYYLTDIFPILLSEGKRVIAVQAVTAEDVLSVNNRRQLAEVDLVMQDRIQREWRDAGVSIVSPINTYIEAGVNIGRDTVIHPFTFIGHDADIGPACVIGPFAMIPCQSLVPEQTTLAGHLSPQLSGAKY